VTSPRRPTDADDVTTSTSEQWWQTAISDIAPGVIRLRGYAIEELIGQVTFTEMLWLMLRGDLPSPAQRDLLDAALVAAVDHGPQAPSIASARMAVTCGVGLNSAMANGVNILGDIHGGAGQQCMENYERVARQVAGGASLAQATSELVEAARQDARPLPGFGHRIHPVDPRVAPIANLVRAHRVRGNVSGQFLDIGFAIEAALDSRSDRRVPMNIDGITAVVFCELGFVPELGRGLFIISRSVGILAHAFEELQSGSRLKGPMPRDIKPRYIGPAPRSLPR
jgi:citrate synthase